LLDVKTIIRVDRLERTAQCLHQLVGYAWLDIRDRYRIRQVGLYLARHGVLLTWPLEELADRLLGGRMPCAEAQREFVRVAHRVLSAEGPRFQPDNPRYRQRRGLSDHLDMPSMGWRAETADAARDSKSHSGSGCCYRPQPPKEQNQTFEAPPRPRPGSGSLMRIAYGKSRKFLFYV
jgi:hypothetical protein